MGRLNAAGIEVAFFTSGGRTAKLGTGRVGHVAIFAKERLTLPQAFEVAKAGGDLDGMLTPLHSAILWWPLDEGAPTVKLVQPKASPGKAR